MGVSVDTLLGKMARTHSQVRWLAWTLLLFSGVLQAQVAAVERRVYEGVASWRGKTIGTLILLEGNAESARGWIRLNTYLPIDSGKLTKNGAEFRSGANTYTIDDIEKDRKSTRLNSSH